MKYMFLLSLVFSSTISFGLTKEELQQLSLESLETLRRETTEKIRSSKEHTIVLEQINRLNAVRTMCDNANWSCKSEYLWNGNINGPKCSHLRELEDEERLQKKQLSYANRKLSELVHTKDLHLIEECIIEKDYQELEAQENNNSN